MKQAIVTGASKGLGKAIAFELAKKGYDLLLVARSEELLENTATAIRQNFSVKASTLSTDLSKPEAATVLVKWCDQQNFQPSVLVNNAGYACWGRFEELTWEEQQAMLQVNVGTLLALTHLLIDKLKQHPKAYILNVASTSSFQPLPTMAVYSASKVFVRSFSKSLRYELRHTNISVTCLTPGPVDTEFITRAGMEVLKPTAKKFEMRPEVVAQKGLKAMFNRKAEVIPGFPNFLSGILSNLIPDSILIKIAAGIYEKVLPSRKVK